MDLKEFKEERELTYDQLGELFNMTRSRAFDILNGRKGCLRLYEINTILQKSDGLIQPEDIGLEAC